jgi:hypothetical protein
MYPKPAKPYNLTELVGELVTAAFSGMLTFWLCEQADIAPLMTSALVGISGHMGSRTLFLLKKMIERKLPLQ